MTSEYLKQPIDPTSADLLAASGLRFGVLDSSSPTDFAEWSQAVSRGFVGTRDTPEQVEQLRGYFSDRRSVGVWDDSAADAASPVATVASWQAALSVPGQKSVDVWAISDVTVAPTHRRRGIATQLLESELRTARALGLPLAALTVSESTIYGRFGFAPAAQARSLTINTRRARWTGPIAPGRVQFVTSEQLLSDGHALIERVRLDAPGQIQYVGLLWERQLGALIGDEKTKGLRFVRYDDEDGAPQGFAIYRIEETEPDFVSHELKLLYLVTATDDAYAALWRFVLEHDLVSTVTASLRPLDEPVRWMISDFRAVTTSDIDHLWTRILDVPAALEARSYFAPGRVVIEVNDRLGFAAGRWALEVSTGGAATVVPTTDDATVTMDVNELAAIYLGGVAPGVLRRAGRIAGETAVLDGMFVSPVAPWLSIWF